MRRALIAAAMTPLLLGGCETVYKQVPTITAAEAPSAIRFAEGNALMMSDGPLATVWLRPIRYYAGHKVFFEIVVFNHSNQARNFGTEDISLATEDGQPLRVQDWDELQHYAHKRNPFGRFGDTMAEELTQWHLNAVAHRTPDQAVMWQTNDHQFFASYQAVQYQLQDAVVEYSLRALQTTTIDPNTTYGGVVYADQPDVPPGGERQLLINVHIGNARTEKVEDHRFQLRLAAEGTPTPIPRSLPAVTRDDVISTRRHCQTWMWDKSDPRCHPNGPTP